MSVLVYETDLGVYLNKHADLDNIVFKSGEAMITIEIDGVSQLKGSNALLVQQVADRCFPIVKREAAALMTTLKSDVDPITDEKKRKAALDKELESFNEEVAKKLIEVACKVFTAFAKEKKDYKVYKVKAGVKIAVNGAGLAASIALTAAAGWTGVGTVVGVVGMVRTAASITQQVLNLSKDSMDIFKRIVINQAKLEKQLASPAVKANTAKQVAATVANKIFAVEIESIVVTVDGIESDFKLLLSKVKGNKVNSVKLAAEIPKMLDQQDQLNADIKDLLELGVLTKKQSSELAKLEQQQTKSEGNLDTLLKEVIGLQETVTGIETWVTKYHADVAALKQKYNPNVVKGAGMATDFLLAASSFAAANFNDPASTLKDLNDASKVVVTALGLTNDGISSVKDIGISIYGAIKD